MRYAKYRNFDRDFRYEAMKLTAMSELESILEGEDAFDHFSFELHSNFSQKFFRLVVLPDPRYTVQVDDAWELGRRIFELLGIEDGGLNETTEKFPWPARRDHVWMPSIYGGSLALENYVRYKQVFMSVIIYPVRSDHVWLDSSGSASKLVFEDRGQLTFPYQDSPYEETENVSE
jgi:hypothetical protein